MVEDIFIRLALDQENSILELENLVLCDGYSSYIVSGGPVDCISEATIT